MDANGQYVTCSHLPKLPLRLHCPIIWLRRLWRNVLRNTWTSTTAWCSQWAPINSNRLTMSCNVLHCLTYRELLACLLPCVHRIGMFWLPSSYQTGKSQNNFCLFDCYDVCLKGATPQWSHWSHEVSTLQMPLVMFLDACEHCARICQDLGSVFGSLLDRFRARVEKCYPSLYGV